MRNVQISLLSIGFNFDAQNTNGHKCIQVVYQVQYFFLLYHSDALIRYKLPLLLALVSLHSYSSIPSMVKSELESVIIKFLKYVEANATPKSCMCEKIYLLTLTNFTSKMHKLN